MDITVRELVQKLLNYPLDARVCIVITKKIEERIVTFEMMDLEIEEATGVYPNTICIMRDKSS